MPSRAATNRAIICMSHRTAEPVPFDLARGRPFRHRAASFGFAPGGLGRDGPHVSDKLQMTLGGSRGEPHQTNPRKTSERARAPREAPEKGRAAGQREDPEVAEPAAGWRRGPGYRRHRAWPPALAVGRRGRNVVVRTFRSARNHFKIVALTSTVTCRSLTGSADCETTSGLPSSTITIRFSRTADLVVTRSHSPVAVFFGSVPPGAPGRSYSRFSTRRILPVFSPRLFCRMV